jgi:hypothetical protein
MTTMRTKTPSRIIAGKKIKAWAVLEYVNIIGGDLLPPGSDYVRVYRTRAEARRFADIGCTIIPCTITYTKGRRKCS